MDTDPAAPTKPILAVDVDGVISLFGWDGPPEQAPGQFRIIDGIAHCISHSAGERLRRLLPHYELVWATGWEDRANDYLPSLLGLPALPYLTFDGQARFGSSHWKIPALDSYGRGRPLAWIDDNLDDSAHRWAKGREAPTLLVPTESDRGIEDAHVEVLIGWIEGGYTPTRGAVRERRGRADG